MSLKEIVDRCRAFEVAENRKSSADYIELVFYSKDSDKWSQALTEILDLPAKPAGVKPEEGDTVLTQNFGGIHENQTLFKKPSNAGAIIAMLWPWQDGVHTTLKLIYLKPGP